MDEAPALELDFEEQRGTASNNTDVTSANWQPWSDVPPAPNPIPGQSPQWFQPQPLVSDITLDGNGGMSIGVKDRFSDQSGFQADTPSGDNTEPLDGVGAGDVLHASSDGETWALESNGTSGGNTGSGAFNGQGPGGGEFYEDQIAEHSQTALGAVHQIPGCYENVLSTHFDPSNEEPVWNSQGYRHLSNTPPEERRAMSR